MKKFIRTNENNSVVFMHNKPEQLKDTSDGFMVDEVPEPTPKDGKIAILNYTESRGFWTEYKDKPKTEIEILQNEIDNLAMQVLGLQGVL